MTTHKITPSCWSEPRLPWMYSPDFLPLLQSLLATLAEIDFAYESDVETIRNSSVEECLKRAAIRRLQEHHRERREPYVRQLEALENRIRALAA